MCLFPVESTALTAANQTAKQANNVLSFCQRLVKHCGARVSLIRDVLVDAPVRIHVRLGYQPKSVPVLSLSQVRESGR